MWYPARAMSPVVTSLALLGCEQVLVFESPRSDAGQLPVFDDDADPGMAVRDGGPRPSPFSADVAADVVKAVFDDAPRGDEPAEGDAGNGAVGCATDPRVDWYAPDMNKLGDRRALRFTLVESHPAPPALGANTLTLHIVTSDSASLAGDSKPFRGDLRARLTMPDHGHPTTVEPVITLDTSTEEYTVDPAYLFMPGVWRIEFDAYYASSAETDAPVDTTAFFFCVVVNAPRLGAGGL
jgi:hypothetical protein